MSVFKLINNRLSEIITAQQNKTNPLGLTRPLVLRRLRKWRYVHKDPSIQYTSEVWNFIKFIFDAGKNRYVENWFGCIHCDQLYNRSLHNGSSSMLRHAKTHSQHNKKAVKLKRPSQSEKMRGNRAMQSTPKLSKMNAG